MNNTPDLDMMFAIYILQNERQKKAAEEKEFWAKLRPKLAKK